MNISKEDIYQKILNKNPNLSHHQIISIQNKIISQLENQYRDKNIQKEQLKTNCTKNNETTNINSKDIYNYYQQFNLQTNTTDYKPRISVPKFQNKLNRNELENNFQNLYSSRTEEYKKDFDNNKDKIIDNLFLSKELELNEQLLIFNLDETFTLEQLKKTYKKLSLIHHPDRGGKEKNFQIINKIYKNLTNYFIEKQPEKQFSDLKSNFNNYTENEDFFINTKLEKDKFNLDIFNKLYEENKPRFYNDEGYGNWKTENTQEENEKTINKFEINSFNTIFQKDKPTIKQTQIIEYQEPQPSHKGTNLGFTEILDEKIDNFSNSLDSNLHFTDYKEAHSNTHLINVDELSYKTYNNIEQLEKDREKISYKMDLNDKIKYEKYKQQKELMEKERIKKIEETNKINEINFKKINKLMISSMK